MQNTPSLLCSPHHSVKNISFFQCFFASFSSFFLPHTLLSRQHTGTFHPMGLKLAGTTLVQYPQICVYVFFIWAILWIRGNFWSSKISGVLFQHYIEKNEDVKVRRVSLRLSQENQPNYTLQYPHQQRPHVESITHSLVCYFLH